MYPPCSQFPQRVKQFVRKVIDEDDVGMMGYENAEGVLCDGAGQGHNSCLFPVVFLAQAGWQVSSAASWASETASIWHVRYCSDFVVIMHVGSGPYQTWED